MRWRTDRVDYVVPSYKVVMRMTAGRENPQFNVDITPLGGGGGWWWYTYNSHSQKLLSLIETNASKILYIGLIYLQIRV